MLPESPLFLTGPLGVNENSLTCTVWVISFAYARPAAECRVFPVVRHLDKIRLERVKITGG
jgi:hypothetical protein